MSVHSALPRQTTAPALARHAARDLTEGRDRAHIVLDGQARTLRIPRAGTLILTK